MIAAISKSKAVIFALLAALVLSRFPSLWSEPRFWGEEATIYFAYALNHPALDALLKTHQNYFGLVVNMATWLATLPPLEYAPYATQTVALVVQLLPLGILVFGRFAWLPAAWSQALAATAILFVTHTDEIWLNSITSHTHLTLACFLLLVMETPRARAGRIFYIGMFALCGVSSIPACFLLPMAAYKAYRSKQQTELLACALLALGCAVELLVILAHYGAADQPRRPFRIDGFSFVIRTLNQTIGAIWTADPDSFRTLLYKLRPLAIASGHPQLVMAALVFAFCLFVCVALWRGVTIFSPFHRAAFIYGFFVILFLSLLTSLDGYGGLRYSYVPNSILMLLAVANVAAGTRDRKIMRFAASASLVLAALLVWVPIYYTRPCCYSKDWPVWKDQAEAARRGETDKIILHPLWQDQPIYFAVPDNIRR